MRALPLASAKAFNAVLSVQKLLFPVLSEPHANARRAVEVVTVVALPAT